MDMPPWKFLIAAALTAFCGTFQIIYHSSIINVPQTVFMDFINLTNIERTGSPMSDDALAVLWGWIVTVFSFGGLIGSMITPFLAEKLGRKFSFMILCNLVAIGSSLLMSFSQMAHSYEMLAVGRFIMGISSGVSSTLLPVYLTECSPMKYMGLIGSFQNVFMNLNGLFAYVISIPEAWGTANSLPYLLSFSMVPALIQILSSFFIMESPKYLYIKRKDIKAAEKSVRFWFVSSNSNSAEEVKQAFHQFDQEAEAEQAAMKEQVGFFRAIKVPYFRKAIVIATLVLLCQTFTGAAVVYTYSTGMFMTLGFSMEVAGIFTIMIAVVNLVGAFVIAPFVEKRSRRACFFSSYFVLFVTLVTYAVFSAVYDMTALNWLAYTAIAFMFIYSFAFNMGAGALTYIIPAEVSPQAVRSTALSVGSSLNWGIGLVTTFVYPPFALKAGAWSLFMFIIPLFFGLIYLYKFMPETRGRNVADIMNEKAPYTIELNKVADGKDNNETNGVFYSVQDTTNEEKRNVNESVMKNGLKNGDAKI